LFGRWLRLLRDGPDLLGAASLDAVPQAAECCDCDVHRRDAALSLIRGMDVAVSNFWRDEYHHDPSA